MDRWIQCLSVLIRALCCSIVVKRELGQKAKPSYFWSNFVPTLTYGYKIWVVTERMRLQIQAAEMSFLWRVAGLSLGARVRSSRGPGVLTEHTTGITFPVLGIPRYLL